MLYTTKYVCHGWTLTCAHMSGRVRVPPPICSTCSHHCCIWNKSCVTSEGYLSTLSCVLIWQNEAIPRSSWITTVDWEEEGRRIHYTVTGNHGQLHWSSLSHCNQPIQVSHVSIMCRDKTGEKFNCKFSHTTYGWSTQ